MECVESDILVIGAGVIGLSVAAHVPRSKTLFVIESHPKFGWETSSRNSEVVHSGIYYPSHSMKTKWCISGREQLYAYCKENNVPHEKVGKFVVAVDADEEEYLSNLSKHAQEMGVPVKWVSANEIKAKEPLINVKSALYFSESGIVDSHQYMASLEKTVLDHDGVVAYHHRVVDFDRDNDHWVVDIKGPDGTFKIRTPVIVNCAGLAAAELTQKALNTNRYEHRYCRGRYFSLSTKFEGKFNHLIYPVPQKDGLGIHVTIDLAKQARLGPDTDWSTDHRYSEVEKLYDCDWDQVAPKFIEAVNRYCPAINLNDLTPGMIGIRPKLFVDGEAKKEFLVESTDGFIHCLGIESPGLTSSLAIQAEVQSQLSHLD